MRGHVSHDFKLVSATGHCVKKTVIFCCFFRKVDQTLFGSIFRRSNRFQRLRHGILHGSNHQFFDDRFIRSKVTTFFGLAIEKFSKKYQKISVTIFIEKHMKSEIFEIFGKCSSKKSVAKQKSHNFASNKPIIEKLVVVSK